MKVKAYVVYNITDYQNVLAISLTRKGAEEHLKKHPYCEGWIEEITLTEGLFEFPDY